MKNRKKLILSLAVCIALSIPTPAAAEYISSSTWGYAVDLPEGFALAESAGDVRFLFKHTAAPVECLIAVYPNESSARSKTSANDPETVLRNTFAQLKTPSKDMETASFLWKTSKAAVGQALFPVPGGGSKNRYQAWAAAAELDGGLGSVVVMAYTNESAFEAWEVLLISAADSLCVNDGSPLYPGPLTSFAWRDGATELYPIAIAGRQANVPLSSIDADANQSVIDREFALLQLYYGTPLMSAAWDRYYRTIYRDAYGRLERAAFVIGNILRYDKTTDGEPVQNDEYVARSLLAWTQNFEYVRDLSGSDFLNLPEALTAQKGDCDSRVMLLVILLHHNTIDAIMMLSEQASHAVAGISLDESVKGARFPYSGKKYLTAETTASVDLGLIDASISDISYWRGISFYGAPF